jgi:hypothetical protein
VTRTLTLVAAAATLAVSGGPAAAPAGARFTASEGQSAVRIAWGYWHSLRPGQFARPEFGCSHEAVELDWLADLGTAMAGAIIGGCAESPPVISLERPTVSRLGDVRACGVVTHEFGHLLGFRHSSNADNVMSGDRGEGARSPRRATWKRAWRRCRRAL